MKTTVWSLITASLLVLLAARPGETLSGKDVVRLKQAGISDQTIQVIEQEKTIETAAFTVADIVEMKKAGLGEETLRMLIKESSFLRNTDPIVYGNDTRSIRFTTTKEVIELKKAGLSDEVIRAIIAVTGERYYSEREESLNLLRNMNIWVDDRRGN